LILEDGQSVFKLKDISINRMLVCGKCPVSNVDPQRAKMAFRSSITVLADKIDRFDEWGSNPEAVRSNKIETGRIYRKREAESIRERLLDSRMEQKIKQLRGQRHENSG